MVTEALMQKQEKTITALRAGQVSSLEVLGNALSNIAPAVTAGVTISLVAAIAGTATLMVYAIVGLLMLFIAVQIATLSYHVPSAGGIYSYVSKALHPFFGFLIAITSLLVIPFSVGTVPLLAGNFLISGLSSIFSFQDHRNLGAYASLLILALAWYLTRRGVKISTKYGFILEFISIIIFLIIGTIVLFNNHIDYQQFAIHRISLVAIGPAFIFAVFSYGGFETAGNLAIESKNKKTVAPAMMLLSVVLAMLFFMFLSYVIVLGFSNNTTLLGITAAPFNHIGNNLGLPWMGPLTDFAMALALLSGVIAIFNTISRTLYSMGVHCIIPKPFAKLHAIYMTPVLANNVVLLLVIPITILVLVAHFSLINIMNAVEGVTSMVLGGSFLLSSFAVPVILWKNRFRGWIFRFNILLTLLVSVPVLGFIFYNALNPFPAGVAGYFMIIFGGLTVVTVVVYITGNKNGYIGKIANSFISD